MLDAASLGIRDKLNGWLAEKAVAFGMSRIGNATIQVDEDGVAKFYQKAGYDAELGADTLEWGGQTYKITQDGRGGNYAFYGGTLSIGYRELGAYVEPLAAKVGEEVSDGKFTVLRPPDTEHPDGEEVAADGGMAETVEVGDSEWYRVELNSFDQVLDEDVIEIDSTEVGVSIEEVKNLAPHQFDPKKLVDAERRGYLYAKEESSMMSVGLIIGILILGLALGALIVWITSSGGGGGGSVIPI